MILQGNARSWLIARVPGRYRARARYWYRAARGRLDRELRLLSTMLQPGTIAVDVGAHDGIYSYFFNRHGLTVHAFEPLPEKAALLRNGLPEIVVHEVALGQEPGAASLLVPLNEGHPAAGRAVIAHAPMDAAATYPVRVETLDSFELRGVSILKVDVEGHELAVLSGARATIDRDQPLMLLELEERHLGAAGWDRAAAQLEEIGYRGYFIDPSGAVRRIEDFDVGLHQRLEHGEPLDPYVNNFIFAAGQRGADSRLSAQAAANAKTASAGRRLK